MILIFISCIPVKFRVNTFVLGTGVRHSFEPFVFIITAIHAFMNYLWSTGNAQHVNILCASGHCNYSLYCIRHYSPDLFDYSCFPETQSDYMWFVVVSSAALRCCWTTDVTNWQRFITKIIIKCNSKTQKYYFNSNSKYYWFFKVYKQGSYNFQPPYKIYVTHTRLIIWTRMTKSLTHTFHS